MADTLDALVDRFSLDLAASRRTLEAYDTAVTAGRFDPTIRDGLATGELVLPRVQRLDSPPFVAYPVTGGTNLTSGGVRTPRALLMSTSRVTIAGLYACYGLVRRRAPGLLLILLGSRWNSLRG
jgi:tricarballylate dehydrogenase